MIGQRSFHLEGNNVRLRPMTESDIGPLFAVGNDEALWIHYSTMIRSEQDMRTYVHAAITAREAGTACPFVITLTDDTVVGSTRFANIDELNRRVEIGWTWIAKPWQRTFVNTEMKYLMLCHAFEVWTCVRVELKTGTQNERSRKAIRRIGAREEGILRRHMKLHDGSYRDTVYHSILDHEWPDVKKRLESRLASKT